MEKRNHKGSVSINDFEIVYRNEDRSDKTVETVERILKIIEAEKKDEQKRKN